MSYYTLFICSTNMCMFLVMVVFFEQEEQVKYPYANQKLKVQYFNDHLWPCRHKQWDLVTLNLPSPACKGPK